MCHLDVVSIEDGTASDWGRAAGCSHCGVCVCVCVCVCVYVRTYACMYTHLCVYVYTPMPVRIHTYACMYTYVCVYLYSGGVQRMCVRIHMHSSDIILNPKPCVYVYICTLLI